MIRRTAVLLGLVLLPLGCGGATGTQARVEPDGGIAYLVPGGGIRVRDLQTGERTNLTGNVPYPSYVEIVGWKDDGRTLTYVVHRGRRGADVYAINVSSRARRRLAHYKIDGAIAPAAGLVAAPAESCEYDRAAGRDLAAPLRLRIYEVSGRPRSEFAVVRGQVATTTVRVAAWAPDATRLAYEVIS